MEKKMRTAVDSKTLTARGYGVDLRMVVPPRLYKVAVKAKAEYLKKNNKNLTWDKILAAGIACAQKGEI
jgi:hypothetical protein